MMRKLFSGFLVLLLIGSLAVNTYAGKGKYLFILQAGRESHEGMARAVHALLYSKELKEHGYEVVLVFDGAGTEWIAEWSDPDSTDKLAPMYREWEKSGISQVVCDYCSIAFHVKQALTDHKVSTFAEYQGHPSIAKWVDRGYQVIVL